MEFELIETLITRSTKQVLKISNPEYEDVPVILSHQNGKEPLGDYVVVNILDVSQQGLATNSTYIPYDEDGKNEMWFSANFEVMIQFSFFGPKAGKIAGDFRHNVSNNVVCREAYQRNGFSIISRSNLRRNPQQRESKWVNSFNVDLGFYFKIQSRQEIDWVEFVTVNGELFRVYFPEG